MPFVVGETIGPYRIIEQLGQGGMASVFKAYHAALDRYVAIKAMHPAFMEDPNFLARFQREAQVVARLEHPHIVPIYDYSEQEGRPFLVMKYITGETLKARLGAGSLAPEEVENIVQAVGGALAYAHEQGILHRDIKPSNVLLAEDGRIYLADFGLARIAEAGQSTLSTDVMLGTPQYISPEQAMGKRELDVGTDIYSFGVMLYEMTVGQVPFSADTPYSIIHDHIYTPLPLPRKKNPGVSESLERVLLKALAKEPGDRFGQIADLQQAFLPALHGEAVSVPAPVEAETEDPAAHSDPGEGAAIPVEGDTVASPAAAAPVEPAAPPTRRWRWWYAIPLIGLLCLCGFIALSVLNESRGAGGVAEQPAAELPAGEPIPGGDAEQPGPGSTGDDMVQAAQQAVRERPDDPFAHLELALALLEVGDLDGAQVQLQESQDLAGEDNPGFYLEAGDVLAEREYWALAAGMYLRFVAIEPRELPPDVRERIELSLFLAAGEPRARALLNLGDRLDAFDPLLADTVRARYQLYLERPDLAQEIIDSVLERAPDFGPGLLQQAELHLVRGEIEPAREILQMLLERDAPPPWVPMLADLYLNEIQD